MEIHVTSGLGSGPTKLAALDSALNQAGIANFNLIRLSSVIPPHARIVEHAEGELAGRVNADKWGDRLYLVYAEQRANRRHTEAWAGIGWIQDPETGRGLFVEHEGHSKESVSRDIHTTLTALMATRNMKPQPIHMRVTGQMCIHEPVAAFVAAVYHTSKWSRG